MSNAALAQAIASMPHSSNWHPGSGGSRGGRGGNGAPRDYLAPLSPQQIVNQARNTIGKAYAPQYQDLNQQSTQVQAINAKRSADNKYYQSWLDTQMQALQSHADAAHAQLSGLEQSLHDQQQSLYGGQQPQLVGQANDRAGNVSNNAQSSAFGPTLTQNQQANMGMLNASQTQSTQGMESSNDQLSGARANDTAFIQAAEQGRIGDLNKALTTLANARSKLNTAKTADIAKEIARLQGVEIQKAQSNRDFAAASTKLGIQVANTNSLISSRAGNLALGAQRNQIALTRAQNSQMNSDRTYQLDVQKFNAQTAKDLYERDHGLGPYRVSGHGSTKPPLTQASQNSIYNNIDKVTGEVNQLVTTYGLTPTAAWHMLANGGYVNGPVGANGKPSKVHFNSVGNVQLLNAAYNLRSGGPGLSPGDIAALKHLGLATPEKRYAHYNNSISPGGAASPH